MVFDEGKQATNTPLTGNLFYVAVLCNKKHSHAAKAMENCHNVSGAMNLCTWSRPYKEVHDKSISARAESRNNFWKQCSEQFEDCALHMTENKEKHNRSPLITIMFKSLL